jgi:hypothetical protein
VVKVARGYLSSFCQGDNVSVYRLVETTTPELEELEQQRFVMVWSPDWTCGMGSSSGEIGLLVVMYDRERELTWVNALESSPMIALEGLAGAYIDEPEPYWTGKELVLHGLTHAEDDANCCPSKENAFVMTFPVTSSDQVKTRRISPKEARRLKPKYTAVLLEDLEDKLPPEKVQPLMSPRLRVAAPRIKGDCDASRVREALKRKEPDLLACYEQALNDSPELRGSITYEFRLSERKISSSGVVKDSWEGARDNRRLYELKTCKGWDMTAKDFKEITRTKCDVEWRVEFDVEPAQEKKEEP